MDLRVVFVYDEEGSWPQRKLAEAELHFGDDAGPLAGLKLVGFTVWKADEGRKGPPMFVTLPARAFGSGADRRYFDFLRPAESLEAEEYKRALYPIKDVIAAAWRQERKERKRDA